MLLHLAVHQRKVSPKALAAQLVLVGGWRDTRTKIRLWSRAGLTLGSMAVGPRQGRVCVLFPSFHWTEWWQASLWTTATAPVLYMSPLNLIVTCGPLFSFYRQTCEGKSLPQGHTANSCRDMPQDACHKLHLGGDKLPQPAHIALLGHWQGRHEGAWYS